MILSALREIDVEAFTWRCLLVKNGPAVGVATFYAPPFVDGEFVDRTPRWQALVGTDTTARAILMGDALPIEVDGVGLRNLEPVEPDEYRFLVADADHARKWRPDHPKAQPRKAVDFNTLPMRF